MIDRFYLLKIQLLNIEPAIWRRFVVPSSISLDRLHDVIQIVMGWTDTHLFEFTIGKKRYTERPHGREDGLRGERYRLEELIRQKGRTFSYIYDFGDGWEHEIVIEDNRYFDPDQIAWLVCLEGERHCPPENVGGVPGYIEFLKILKDNTHEAHEQYIEWAGGKFDSELFDQDFINWQLMQYLRWSRDRYRTWEGYY